MIFLNFIKIIINQLALIPSSFENKKFQHSQITYLFIMNHISHVALFLYHNFSFIIYASFVLFYFKIYSFLWIITKYVYPIIQLPLHIRIAHTSSLLDRIKYYHRKQFDAICRSKTKSCGQHRILILSEVI